MNIKKYFAIHSILLFTHLFAHGQERVINYLLANELKNLSEESLPISWVFSNEGGVIRYAELDIVGDERKEIIYDRSTYSSLYKIGKPIYIYYQPEDDSDPVSLGGEVYFNGFHKKEGEKSIFLKASNGRNFDTADEKAFTKTLAIQEVSTSGVNNTVHIINDDSSAELRKLWEAANRPHAQNSINSMKERGFTYASPLYKWVDVKDYVSGDYEWKDYDVNEWSSLSEFSIESQTWSVNKNSITSEYLNLARTVYKIRSQDESYVSYEDVDLPDGYLTPKVAYDSLLGIESSRGKGESFLNKVSKNPIETSASSNNSAPPDKMDANESHGVSSQTNWPYYLAGILLMVLLGGFVLLKKK